MCKRKICQFISIDTSIVLFTLRTTMKTTPIRWLFRIFYASIILFLLWQIIMFFSPRPPSYTTAEKQAITMACDRFVREMTATINEGTSTAVVRPATSPALVAGIAHLLNDSNEMATAALKDALRSSGRYEVHEGSVLKKFFSDVTDALSESKSLEEVLRAGQKVKLDLVLAGRVVDVVLINESKATAKLELLAWDTREAKIMMRQTIEATAEIGWEQKAGQMMRGLPAHQRLIIWLAIVASAPWLTAFATHRVLEKKSNASSFLLILVYALFGTALAMLLITNVPGSSRFGLTTLLALAVSAGYSFWACERIAANK